MRVGRGRPLPVTIRSSRSRLEREVGTSLVAGQGVYLVDDDGADGAEHLAAASGGNEEIERLGRRDHDVGWSSEHGGACRRRGVAVADGDPEGPHRVADLLGDGEDRCQRPLEVLRDVDGQCPQRRDV